MLKTEDTVFVYRLGNFCSNSDCDCGLLHGKILQLKESEQFTPRHKKCDCYVIMVGIAVRANSLGDDYVRI